MKPHKVKQLNFNLIGQYSDRLGPQDYLIEKTTEETIKKAVQYLTIETTELSFPSKSYAVALIYSFLLEKVFKDNFYESLNDKNLFCNTDIHFKTYDEAKNIYDSILNEIGGKDKLLKNSHLLQMKVTIKYFAEEFDLDYRLLIP